MRARLDIRALSHSLAQGYLLICRPGNTADNVRGAHGYISTAEIIGRWREKILQRRGIAILLRKRARERADLE